MNPSGIQPIEFRVLVEPLAISDKVGSIIIPDSKRDQEKYAQTKGRIVAVSPFAFNYFDIEGEQTDKPKAGALVLYAKYAGVVVKGKDGKDYTIISDKDVCAVIEE